MNKYHSHSTHCFYASDHLHDELLPVTLLTTHSSQTYPLLEQDVPRR